MWVMATARAGDARSRKVRCPITGAPTALEMAFGLRSVGRTISRPAASPSPPIMPKSPVRAANCLVFMGRGTLGVRTGSSRAVDGRAAAATMRLERCCWLSAKVAWIPLICAWMVSC